ncbi:ribosomal-protein-alanine N-acetyltransferase [Bifidobacterium sp. BRDM6]|uniref:Ribosomal-protein-alanine N-acetyltransferase n=1 Tax=Bifidobacterium choloepi TaxID=2614131 RepID=A0A6I5N5L2_9BIFI|nr:ribosomal-protein-alanine N-acetyltransferase [Bifidobacterium choloepi]
MELVDLADIDRDVAVRRLAALESDLFGRGAWSENAVRQELDAPARTYLLAVDRGDDDGAADGNSAVDGDMIVGYAGFWYDGDDAELMTIGVARDRQRRGIASRLLDALLDDARRRGAARMLLEVRVDNDPAIGLYRSRGFERLGLRKRYYQPEGIDAYTMSVELRPRTVGFTGSTAE